MVDIKRIIPEHKLKGVCLTKDGIFLPSPCQFHAVENDLNTHGSKIVYEYQKKKKGSQSLTALVPGVASSRPADNKQTYKQSNKQSYAFFFLN